MVSELWSSAPKAVDQVRQASGEAVDATKAYANAVDVAKLKLRVQSRLESTMTNAIEHIDDDLVRAAKLAMFADALLPAASVMLACRSR